jgi:methionyl-tRNA synthetase
MNQKILVGVAWPYANSHLHLGQLAGAYIPPDIFSRYHRLRGNDVLMVSGSDTHGTPITVTAEQEGTSPNQVIQRYHQSFLDSLQGLGISFDLFTHTDTENHWQVTTDMFKRMLDKGHIYKETMRAFYDPIAKRFLADRYVEGTCPFCGFDNARGDQCDNCGKPLDAPELIEPRSRFSGTKPEIRETEHFFLDLAQFNSSLTDYVLAQDHWRPSVRNFSLNLLREGLRGRAISRDIDWGIPVPVKGYEHKRIYVWFDAVIGYFAASVEWARNNGVPDQWHSWWDEDADARSYYFVGKDNIFFHTLIWPAMLMAYGGLKLPFDVPANEWLTLEGRKLSSSRNWAVWAPDYLERYDPDPLRYCLTVHAPETSDSDFTWQDFLERNNNELVGTWGNLAYRMLSFAQRNFEAAVPRPGNLNAEDQQILRATATAFEEVGTAIEACRFRNAVGSAMALAREANRYLDAAAPWKHLKTDRERAATTTYVTLRVIDSLKILFTPFLPFSSQALHEALGYQGSIMGSQQVDHVQESTRDHTVLTYQHELSGDLWQPSDLPPGQPLGHVRPLFVKLDESIVEEEIERLHQHSRPS